MAIMIPDTIKPTTISTGEKWLFNRFRRELPNNIYVIHSLGLTNHKHKLWAECDFVILCSDGIFIIEVKSGGVSCEHGQWIFTDRFGEKFHKHEGPFEQAVGAMYSVKSTIEDENHLKGFLYGYGVITPDEEFETTGAEIDLNVVLNKSNFKNSLDEYVEHLGRYWNSIYSQKHQKQPRIPSKRDLDTIRQLLRPDIYTAYTLNSELSSLENEQVELTDEQSRILKRLDNNPRTIVAGGAGTGKTLLAVDKAIRVAKSDKRVLYLCYNRLLGDHIRTSIKKHRDDLSIEAYSIHNWFSSTIMKSGRKMPNQEEYQNAEEYYQELFSQEFIEASIDLDLEPYDVIIIDEGQDLMRDSYLEAIDLSLKGGIDQGLWHIFYDPNQNIFFSDIEPVIKRLNEYGVVHYSLNVNCRNTLEVAIATATFSGIYNTVEGAIEGGHRKDVFYSSKKDLVTKIEKTLNNLLSGDIKKSDIIFLSKFRIQNSSLASSNKLAGLYLNDLSASRTIKKNSIDFCTIQSFKGLERRAVLVVDMDELLAEDSRFINYCGLSRARTFLTLFINNKEKSAYDNLSKEFGKQIPKLNFLDK
jgi:hypothetical protein